MLAFPANLPEVVELETPFLGDVVICPKVIEAESAEQNKTCASHLCHIVVHGVLHLLGFDHIEDKDAEIMQQQEITILRQIGFENPYQQEV